MTVITDHYLTGRHRLILFLPALLSSVTGVTSSRGLVTAVAPSLQQLSATDRALSTARGPQEAGSQHRCGASYYL